MLADANDIHRKALRAAAAVAFGVSGCAEPVAAVQGSPAAASDSGVDSAVAADSAAAADTGAPDSDSVQADAADAVAPVDVAKADVAADVGTAADAIAEIAQPKDVAAVAETVAGDAAGKPDCSKAQQGGDWAKCCDELRAWCEAAFGAGSQASNECQFGPNFNGSTGCTPWGPAAPPAWAGAVA